jgi:hypothetical protein
MVYYRVAHEAAHVFAGQEGLRDRPADAQIGFLGSGTQAAQAE